MTFLMASRAKLEQLTIPARQTGEGAVETALISAAAVGVEERLADLCREPKCSYYGLSAHCPPHTGGAAWFRDLLREYEHALVVRMDIPTDRLAADELQDVLKFFQEIVSGIEKAAIEAGFPRAKAFGAGSCKIAFCREYGSCSVLKGRHCRYPDKARPSIEAQGVNVSELSRAAGFEAPDGSGAGGFFGLVLIE